MSVLLFNALLLLLLDFYIYKALKATNIKWAKTRTFTYLWWGYSFLLLLGVILAIFINLRLAVRSIILVALFITFSSKVVYMLVLLADDIRRGAVWLKRLAFPRRRDLADPLPEQPVKGISRSDFLTRAGLLVAAIPFTGLSWGIISGAHNYRIRRQQLFLPNLPKAFHGIKIGQLSDIHSGSFYNKKAVLGGVEMLLAEKPDIIFFTGDLINNLASEMRDYQDIFARLKAPLGVYSVLGNHDYGEYYYGKAPSPAKAKNLQLLKDTHKVMGWDLLLNEHRRLKVDGEEIGILGVENWGTGRFPKYGDLGKTLKNTDDLPVKLLLSHDPSHWRAEILNHPDIDVTFAGHTHGMQFGVQNEHIKWSPVQYLYKEWSGLYKQQQQQLYVNVGFGYLGYPGRVGILPEITVFELVSGAAV